MRPVQSEDGRFRFSSGQRMALWFTALLYLGGALAVYFFIDKAVLSMALALPLSVVAAMLALSLCNYAVRAWRWVVLADYLGMRVPVRDNIVYYLAGYCLTSTPGKAGEAVRLWFLKSGHGVPYARSLPLMLADRVIDMWAVLLLSLVSCAAFMAYAWQGAALTLLVVAISVPILRPRWFEPLLGGLRRLMPHHARLLVRVRRTMRSMQELAHWRTYGLTLLPTVAGWFAECAALYLLLGHLGAEVSLLNAVFVFSFSVIVGAVSMLPGGLGSTEATIVILLKMLGVDLDVALAATAIIRITTFWFAVAIGGVLLPLAVHTASRSHAERVPAEHRSKVA
jgi:uncharacterized membrane protein YbhN (UPF0104 family)